MGILDLVIIRQGDTGAADVIKYPQTISDHCAIVCGAYMPRPPAMQHYLDSHSLVDRYNDILKELIDEHAPIRARTVTLRPYTPWFNASFCSLKRPKTQAERRFVTTGLEVHRQMYVEQCRVYSDALNTAKREYYRDQIFSF